MSLLDHIESLEAALAAAEAERDALRAALIETRLKPGVRWVISHLHKRAAEMNHYPCKQWLNSLGYELGNRISDERIDIEAALDVATARALSGKGDGE